MIPQMPALIPTNPGNCKQLPRNPDELQKNIADQLQLVETLRHVLLIEQKKLEMMWKQKHKNERKNISVRSLFVDT